MSNQRESDEVTVRVIVKYDGKAAEKEMPYNDVPYEHSLTTISRDLLNSILEAKWKKKHEELTKKRPWYAFWRAS